MPCFLAHSEPWSWNRMSEPLLVAGNKDCQSQDPCDFPSLFTVPPPSQQRHLQSNVPSGTWPAGPAPPAVSFLRDEVRGWGPICWDVLSMSGSFVRLLDCFPWLVRKQEQWVMGWLCHKSPGTWANLPSIHLSSADLMLTWGHVPPGPRARKEQHVSQGHGKGAGQSSNWRKGERSGRAVWGLFTQRQAVMRWQQAIQHGCVPTEHYGSGRRAGRFVSSSSPSQMQLVEGKTSPPSLPLAQTSPCPGDPAQSSGAESKISQMQPWHWSLADGLFFLWNPISPPGAQHLLCSLIAPWGPDPAGLHLQKQEGLQVSKQKRWQRSSSSLTSFYKWGNGGQERLSYFPKVTQLVLGNGSKGWALTHPGRGQWSPRLHPPRSGLSSAAGWWPGRPLINEHNIRKCY